MSLDQIIVFFLLGDLRKILHSTCPSPGWEKKIKLAMYGVVAVFILEIFLPIKGVTLWLWHLLLCGTIVVSYFNSAFFAAKTVLLAVLPFALLSLFKDVHKLLIINRYKVLDNYWDSAITFSIIWMVAMLIVSKKQQKALEKERKKTHEEEEQKIKIAKQKEELENIVAERTSELKQQKEELEHALVELKTTQGQLIQHVKLASLGELTAGIAHEIQNPLNFVNNFSEVNEELTNELKQEFNKINIPNAEKVQLETIIDDIVHNQQKINYHGKRADAIVKAMLQHSRTSSGQKEPTDINALADEYLRLSYHGLRAKDKSFNATMQTDFDKSIGKINVVPQDIGRVLLNLFNNAFYAVAEKKKAPALKGENYESTVLVSTKKVNDKLIVVVRDNGIGIPQKAVDKIFQPFFTTKPTGQGTGLGLSLSYDIIKAHGGEIKVESKEGEGAEFIIHLPLE